MTAAGKQVRASMAGLFLLCLGLARDLVSQESENHQKEGFGRVVAWDVDLCDARRVEDRPESSALARYFRIEFVWLREGELLLVKHGSDVREVAVETGAVRAWTDAPPKILGHLGGDVLVIAYENRIEWLDYPRSKVLGTYRIESGGGAWKAWGSVQKTRIVRPGSWRVRGYDVLGMGESVNRVEDLGDLAWFAHTGRSVIGGPGGSPSSGSYRGPVSAVWGPASEFLGRVLKNADAVYGPDWRLDRELLAIVNGRDVTVWAQVQSASGQGEGGDVKEIILKGIADRHSKVVFIDEKRMAVARGKKVYVYAIDGDGACVAEYECAGNVMNLSAGRTSGQIAVAYNLKGRVHLLCWNVGRG